MSIARCIFISTQINTNRTSCWVLEIEIDNHTARDIRVTTKILRVHVAYSDARRMTAMTTLVTIIKKILDNNGIIFFLPCDKCDSSVPARVLCHVCGTDQDVYARVSFDC